MMLWLLFHHRLDRDLLVALPARLVLLLLLQQTQLPLLTQQRLQRRHQALPVLALLVALLARLVLLLQQIQLPLLTQLRLQRRHQARLVPALLVALPARLVLLLLRPSQLPL
ncbi:MAG: hypothetical protein P4L40_05220 [Terracidiphilus sp.]|nr:hypothetical protein [Terracidiphilus sp.]